MDKAAAGRVKILEKNDPLNKRDVDSHLCVMLLMLQSANRETQETLRMFRDRGNVHGFFPVADDYLAHHQELLRVPNLDVYGERDTMGAIVKDSLGNVLRSIKKIATTASARTIRIGLKDDLKDKDFITKTEGEVRPELEAFDPVYVVRSIVDIVPNPWRARQIVARGLSVGRMSLVSGNWSWSTTRRHPSTALWCTRKIGSRNLVDWLHPDER